MKPYWQQDGVTLYCGDCRTVLAALPEKSVNCCVTSPPYWGLRDYGVDGQIGLEQTPQQYVEQMVSVFREVRRVLRDDGTVWLNLGDSYANTKVGNTNGTGASTMSEWCWSPDSNRAGHLERGDANSALRKSIPPGFKSKDLIGIPWLVAFALRADGWYLRSDIIWSKPNPMPESVTDRPTKAHEYLFLLSKRERYYYDADAIAEPSTDPESLEGYGPRGARRTVAHDSEQFRTRVGFEAMTGKVYETRNRRSVWTVTTQPFPDAHFATFPPKLIEPCILAGCPDGGVVLDPFFGAGTTGLVCQQQHVRCIGVELNPEYCAMIRERLAQGVLPFATGGAA